MILRDTSEDSEREKLIFTAPWHGFGYNEKDDGMLLTGIPAGTRDADGRFPDGTIHALVEQRLERWAQAVEADQAEKSNDH